MVTSVRWLSVTTTFGIPHVTIRIFHGHEEKLDEILNFTNLQNAACSVGNLGEIKLGFLIKILKNCNAAVGLRCFGTIPVCGLLRLSEV